MIYHLLKTNRVISYLLFPLLAAGIWILNIHETMVYPFYEGEDRMPVYNLVTEPLSDYPVAAAFLALGLLIISGILVQRIYNEYGFARTKNLLPFSIFLLTVTGFKSLHAMHPVFFSVIFILLAIYKLFSAYDCRKPYSQLFDAGLLMGTAALFYLNIFILIPAFIAGGSILGRETRWREVMLFMAGALIPWVFLAGYLMLQGEFMQLVQVLEANLLTENNDLFRDYRMVVFLGYLLLLTLAGSFQIIRQYEEKKISIRQYFLVFFLIFLSAVMSLFLIPAVSGEVIILAAIPVSFLLSNMLSALKKQITGEVVMYLMLGLNLYAQF